MRGIAPLWCTIGAFAIALGCGGKKDERPRRDRPADPGVAEPATTDDPVPGPSPTSPAAKAAFPDGTRSLEMVKTAAVRLEPTDEAKRIGTIAIDTRVGWRDTATGKGCKKPWVQLVPHGWVCSDYMKPSTKVPFGREVPMLDRGELVPGIYGKVTAPSSVTYVMPKQSKDSKKKKPQRTGPITSPDQVDDPATTASATTLVEGRPLVGSVNVRQYEELVVDNKTYWRITQSTKDAEYVLRQAISQHRPSLYAGARLGDETGRGIPVAFVWPRVAGWQQAWIMAQARGGVLRQVPARTPLSILETFPATGKPTAYRVGEGEWIAAADVRLFAPNPERPTSLVDGERWIDVDLDNQILVAFEGDIPVYTTMISSGSKEYPTETGIYRMWLKESESDMKGLSGEDPYSVATVPWTQFYSPEKGLALHTAYWHDVFGTRRSHGCLNLAPRDARWLYFWSDPQVPPGWTMAAGVVEAPGSLVRVRSKADPNPPIRGYAKKVYENQQSKGPQ